MTTGYRINYPEENIAWKALNFEYDELSNWHILTDLAHFLGTKVSNDEAYHPELWTKVLSEFKNRYGDTKGIWLTRSKKAAIEYYGQYGGGLLTYEYAPRLIVSDFGDDGFFVLNPNFIDEEWVVLPEYMK